MDIDIPITDTHMHIWDPGRLSYPWLAQAPEINKPHLPEQYRAATEGLSIRKMVFVQCEADFAQFREEVAWVTGQAAHESRIQAIVAWAPLEKGEAAREDLAALAQNPLVRGIRRIIQFEADAGFCMRPDFVRGVQLLAEFDLHFELCIKGDEQFANALELVRRCPDVRFILDHIGKPFIAEGILEPWAAFLKELAALPNTWCKMSGLVSEADSERWTPADLQPYIDRVLSCFGYKRTMFGGDWPVCTLASTYRNWIETLWVAVSERPVEDRRRLFHDNAAEFYRI
jgi:predicted TIM-barrel fold metal-dependent hydrolase